MLTTNDTANDTTGREHFLKTFPLGMTPFYDRAALLSSTGHFSPIISETGLWPVRHDDTDRIRPFDDPKHHFSVFFMNFRVFHEIDEKGCYTAVF